MKKMFFLSMISIIFLTGCNIKSTTNNNDNESLPIEGDTNPTEDIVNIETEYVSNEELEKRKPAYAAFEDPNIWYLQYPSGTEEGGMLLTSITSDYKSKYFSLYEKNNNKYIRFSLDASDKGKSPNGSSVRTELALRNRFSLKDKTTFSYKFFFTSTDDKTAKFTIGQFLLRNVKDDPMLRIEYSNGALKVIAKDFLPDGSYTNRESASLGNINQNEETEIKMEIDNKLLKIYRDGKLVFEHQYSKEVSTEARTYYKVGIYYQNTDSPKIFSEVFVRDLHYSIDYNN